MPPQQEPLALNYAPNQHVPDYYLTLCVCKCPTPYYPSTDPSASPMGSLNDGDLFSMGQTFLHNGVKRIAITLLDGSSGFIPADAKFFRIRNAQIQLRTPVYNAPSDSAEYFETLQSQAHVVVVDEHPSGKNCFYEIRNANGGTGYIKSLKNLQFRNPRANTPKQDMTQGAFMFLLSLIFATVFYFLNLRVSDIPVYYMFIPVVLLGIGLFFRGLIHINQITPSATLLEKLIVQIVDEKSHPSQPPASTDVSKPAYVPSESLDTAHLFHAAVGIFLPFIALPWGIALLRRGRRQTGLALLILSLISLGICFAIIYRVVVIKKLPLRSLIP